jgi:hypothetical protein
MRGAGSGCVKSYENLCTCSTRRHFFQGKKRAETSRRGLAKGLRFIIEPLPEKGADHRDMGYSSLLPSARPAAIFSKGRSHVFLLDRILRQATMIKLFRWGVSVRHKDHCISSAFPVLYRPHLCGLAINIFRIYGKIPGFDQEKEPDNFPGFTTAWYSFSVRSGFNSTRGNGAGYCYPFFCRYFVLSCVHAS